MTLRDDDLRAAWRDRSASALSNRAACLTDDEWTRLLSKDADAQEQARVASHIATCAACAEEHDLLRPLESWAIQVERVLASPDADAAHAPRWTRWAAWWSSPRFGLALAAAMVLLVTNSVTLTQLVESRRNKVQLETRLAENEQRLSSNEASQAALQDALRNQTAMKEQLDTLQQQRQAQLSTPQVDVAIVDLEPRYAEAVRGSSDPQIVNVPADAPAVTLILSAPPLASRSTLEIEVTDNSGQVRWVGRTQRNQGSAPITLSLASAGYPPGEYVIRLLDVTRGRKVLATYPVVVRHTSKR